VPEYQPLTYIPKIYGFRVFGHKGSKYYDPDVVNNEEKRNKLVKDVVKFQKLQSEKKELLLKEKQQDRKKGSNLSE
jgi:hypothetical protein